MYCYSKFYYLKFKKMIDQILFGCFAFIHFMIQQISRSMTIRSVIQKHIYLYRIKYRGFEIALRHTTFVRSPLDD